MIRDVCWYPPPIYPFRPICIPWYVTESKRKRRGEVAYLSEPPSLFYRMRHIDPIERQKLQSWTLGRAKEQERSKSIHSVFSATKTQVVQCLFTEQQPAADDNTVEAAAAQRRSSSSADNYTRSRVWKICFSTLAQCMNLQLWFGAALMNTSPPGPGSAKLIRDQNHLRLD